MMTKTIGATTDDPPAPPHPQRQGRNVTAAWEDLRPYEKQQGGYWAYPKNSGLYGEGKEFTRVTPNDKDRGAA